MKVAIMQPYFFPYAGYFRLFSEVDLFVVYDCVQFPRRGWVHRNRVLFGTNLQWITLPLEKCTQSTNICDLVFRKDVANWSDLTIDKLKTIATPNRLINNFNWSLLQPKGTVVDYLIDTITWCGESLGASTNLVRSSSLGIDHAIKSQERIIEICRTVGATQYLNLSGGTSLYETTQFSRAGIDLSFLPQFQGEYESVLGRFLKEPSMNIRREIC
jgi:hypothetical protein